MSLTEKIAKLPDNSLQFLHDGYFFQERAQPCGDRRRLETGGLEYSWTVMPPSRQRRAGQRQGLRPGADQLH